MAVSLTGLPELHPVAGITLGTTCAGIRYPDRPDLVIMALTEGSTCAAVFTRNAFCAAPVLLAREHVGRVMPRYLLINTGYANAGTGDRGLQDARACCQALAQLAGCRPEEVLPFSTGVIGEPLPVTAVQAGLADAMANLSTTGWAEAAHGILTTDTVAKGASRQVIIDGHPITVTGIAKGAGMIRPDMATMLAFVATDACVSRDVLQRCLEQGVRGSFNRITVDGDTSTNDACVLVATGTRLLPCIDAVESEEYQRLTETVAEVCGTLAEDIVRDGEGATKLITIKVEQGANEAECLSVAYAIAHSPLVKTAVFAGDPNWGRILAAVGRAGLDDLDIQQVSIFLNDRCLVRNGARAPDYTEERGQQVMQGEEITIQVTLARGAEAAQVQTCDLSYDYVRINAEYRT